MRRRTMQGSVPDDAVAVPGIEGWRYWLVKHAGSSYTTHRAYLVSPGGAIVGPCEWNPSTGWFNSSKARESWTRLTDPFVVEAHDAISMVHDALLEKSGLPCRVQWLLDVHRPEYGSHSYMLSIVVQRGYIPQGFSWGADPTIASTYVTKSHEQRQYEAAREWLEKNPQGCPFSRYDPHMLNQGLHRATALMEAAERLRALLSDGQWHSYHEVRQVVEVERLPNGYPLTPLADVAVWGDADYRRDWQTPVYVRGRANHTGRYAAWDSEVARERLELERREAMAQLAPGAAHIGGVRVHPATPGAQPVKF
jgi:hypothetical protein